MIKLFTYKNGGYLLKKVNNTPLRKRIITAMNTLAMIMVFFIMSGNCFAGDIVSIKVYPEHVGVFTTVGKQQFVAFGLDAQGHATNITRDVDWISSNTTLVQINATGLATIGTGITSGQVKITCSYPKARSAGGIVAKLLLNSHKVTPSISAGNGTIAPDNAQSVKNNATTQFTILPADGYHVDSVAGTCGGNLVGTTYTTDTITTDCTVEAGFALDVLTVTPSKVGNGTITPDTPQSVNYGNTTAFTVTADPGYTAAVQSDCGGSLVGDTFTTGPILKSCSVEATFTINTYTLTYGSGSCESISGDSPQTVNYGADGTAVEAVPAAGTNFTKWDDESVANPRTDTNVSADITVNAICEPN
ncbi:MAG: hypothetical protein PHZ02_03975 [Desulfocapsaceae bacterium]|nr:hypothetical protein [Desulfocapsaceae bacterium]